MTDQTHDTIKAGTVEVVAIQPGDRLAFACDNLPDDPETLQSIRDELARWSGLPEDRIAVVSGGRLQLIREERARD